MESIEFLEGHLSKLAVSKDDVVVLSLKGELRENEAKHIMMVLKHAFPSNEVLILTEGVKIGVMEKESEKDKNKT
jgi:hypothetical protein